MTRITNPARTIYCDRVGTDVITGAATDTLEVSSLDLSGVYAYEVIAVIDGAADEAIDIVLNDDVVNANYQRQWIFASGAAVSASRADSNLIGSVYNGETALLRGMVAQASSEYPKFIYQLSAYNAVTTDYIIGQVIWEDTSDVIKIGLIATGNAFAVGSKMVVYKY